MVAALYLSAFLISASIDYLLAEYPTQAGLAGRAQNEAVRPDEHAAYRISRSSQVLPDWGIPADVVASNDGIER